MEHKTILTNIFQEKNVFVVKDTLELMYQNSDPYALVLTSNYVTLKIITSSSLQRKNILTIEESKDDDDDEEKTNNDIAITTTTSGNNNNNNNNSSCNTNVAFLCDILKSLVNNDENDALRLSTYIFIEASLKQLVRSCRFHELEYISFHLSNICFHFC